MNLTKLKQKNKSVGSALMQVALMATSFSASAATAAYYSSRRNAFSTNGGKSYLVDPTMLGVAKDLFKYTKINPTEKKAAKSIKANDLIISATPVKELLVIDQNVKDYQQFARLIKPGVELVEIPKSVDGFAFLLDKLSGYQNLSAIHLFSHANVGELLLGNTQVNSKTLKDNTRLAEVVNQSMKQGGDFLLYGCELGKGEKGDEFLQILKGKTHVDVAASNNLTGNPQFKGDWNLEIAKGNIETKPLANSIAMKDFTEVLQTVTFQPSTWTVVNAGAFDKRFAVNNVNDATAPNFDARVSQGGKTLKIDGEYNSTGFVPNNPAYGITVGRSEKSITISFTDGSLFTPVSIEVYANQGDLAKITTNNGGSMNTTINDIYQTNYQNHIINFSPSSFPAGATSLTITNNSWAPFQTNGPSGAGFQFGIRKITFSNITTPVLPVNLVDFSVKANHNDVALQWQTATESNNKKFVIYRSDDEKAFKELASIDGAGNSSALKNYTFVDKKPLQGNNYYKLVQIDNDGRETELGIKNVAFDLKSHATIYPNPTSDKATITFEAAKYHTLNLSSLDGKELVVQKLSNSQIEASVDLSGYAKGVYFVKLAGANGSVVCKVLKK